MDLLCGMRELSGKINTMASRKWFFTVYNINYRIGPAQDVTFFYMGSHLSELQSCALIFSTMFDFIFIFK